MSILHKESEKNLDKHLKYAHKHDKERLQREIDEHNKEMEKKKRDESKRSHENKKKKKTMMLNKVTV